MVVGCRRRRAALCKEVRLPSQIQSLVGLRKGDPRILSRRELSMSRLNVTHLFVALCLLLAGSVAHGGENEAPATEADVGNQEFAFFEQHIRPLLVAHCYECHSAEAEKLQGGLALDSKPGWMTGGDSGPAIVPGEPDESPLMDAVRYEGYEMPPRGKLPDEKIALLDKWISMGALKHRPREIRDRLGASPGVLGISTPAAA